MDLSGMASMTLTKADLNKLPMSLKTLKLETVAMKDDNDWKYLSRLRHLERLNFVRCGEDPQEPLLDPGTLDALRHDLPALVIEVGCR